MAIGFVKAFCVQYVYPETKPAQAQSSAESAQSPVADSGSRLAIQLVVDRFAVASVARYKPVGAVSLAS